MSGGGGTWPFIFCIGGLVDWQSEGEAYKAGCADLAAEGTEAGWDVVISFLVVVSVGPTWPT